MVAVSPMVALKGAGFYVCHVVVITISTTSLGFVIEDTL